MRGWGLEFKNMPLYEYWCGKCQAQFEQVTTLGDSDAGQCPQCQEKSSHKLISRFAVGGRGDLRESTLHGCHDCDVSPSEEGHSHDEGHTH